MDDYRLTEAAKVITLTLMTPCTPDVSAPGEVRLPMTDGRWVRVAYDRRIFHAVVEEIRIDDEELRHSWGERLYRVLLRAERRRSSQNGRCALRAPEPHPPHFSRVPLAPLLKKKWEVGPLEPLACAPRPSRPATYDILSALMARLPPGAPRLIQEGWRASAGVVTAGSRSGGFTPPPIATTIPIYPTTHRPSDGGVIPLLQAPIPPAAEEFHQPQVAEHL